MSDKSVILAGMAFGDEGKGSFADFFAHKDNAKALVKYSGGSQSGHTVIEPDGTKLRFSQLSSGMFNPGSETYITENMVINLENLIREVNEFARATNSYGNEVIKHVHIHERCIIVTPYHKFINHLIECLNGKKRRGSVGSGVSEAKFMSDTFDISIRFGDLISNRHRLHSFIRLYNYANSLYKKLLGEGTKIPAQVADTIEKEAKMLLDEKVLRVIARRECNHALALCSCKYSSYNEIFKTDSNIIFEGSQGFLIDKDFGLKPNTSLLDTTNYFPRYMVHGNSVFYGIVKAFYSRHGRGVFPTESGYLNNHITDLNQTETYWSGKMRFGWFDAVLFRYASSLSYIDKVLVSSLDQLSGMKEIKICDSYIYDGIVDEEFKETFEYHKCGNSVIITELKAVYDEGITKYLNKCRPNYVVFPGWKADISKVKCFDELPCECRVYVRMLEKFMKKEIEYVSVGPTRDDKILVPEEVKDKKE